MSRDIRWRGAVAVTIVLALVGLADQQPALVVAGMIPLGYVAVSSLTTASIPSEITAYRVVNPTPAPPGRAVTVTLTVANNSDRTIPDLRVADGVPTDLAVLEGTPRAGVALAPGETTTLQYIVAAKRGTHTFRRPHLRVRGAAGDARATTLLTTGGDETLDCRLDIDAPPLVDAGRGRVGRLSTDIPGEGITFHSTREYHPDDPADRLDWRHYAKHGELATTNYEQDVAATVVLVLDARERNHVVAGPGRPTAVEYGAYALTHALTDLLARGHTVGIAVVGIAGDGPGDLAWLAPASGRSHHAQAKSLLATTSETTLDRPDVTAQARQLIDLLPPGAQLLVTSPALDTSAVKLIETLRANDTPVTLLSPDVIPENTVSGQYVQVRRQTRLAHCQATGTRTIDWRRGTPLPIVLAEAYTAQARLPMHTSVRRSGGEAR